MEYIDVLKEDGKITGEKKSRSDVHKYWYWHRSILILFKRSANEVIEIINKMLI